MARAWEQLQQEAREGCQYLGEEVTGQLAVPPEGVGGGTTDGSTRATVTKEREKLRVEVLERALADHEDQTARPVMSCKQKDIPA